MKPFRALFWKEYRQQAVLVVAIIVLCFLLQLSATLMHLWNNYYSLPYFAIAMLTTALYAAGASAIIFSREHEERTFMILRSLPVSGPFLAWGKISWLLVSTAITGLLTTLIAVPWALAMSDSSSFDVVLGACGVGVVEGLCWGLFWSPRTKSQLNALLYTFFSAAVGMQLCTSLYVYVYKVTSLSSPETYAQAAGFRLLLALPVGVLGLYGALNWLMKQDTQPLVDTTEQVKSQSRGTLAHFPFLSLCWITLRQSPTLILAGWLVSLYASAWIIWDILRGVIAHTKDDWFHYSSYDFTSETAYTLAILLPLFLVVYCGSVFFTDQKEKGTRLLAHCGVSPRKIWWSRILVFGSAFLPLAIALITITIAGWFHFDWRIITQYIFGSNYYWEYYDRPHNWIGERMALYYVPVIFTMMFFCVGQMVSLFLRSGIVAIVATGMAGVVFLFFSGMFLTVFGTNVLWSVLPIPILCLVASRLRTGDWLRGRDTFRIWCKPLMVVLIPFVCICVTIPMVRVFCVPKIDLGYRMDPIVLQTPLDNEKDSETIQLLNHETYFRSRYFDHFNSRAYLAVLHRRVTENKDPRDDPRGDAIAALKEYIEMIENDSPELKGNNLPDISLLELNRSLAEYSYRIARTGVIPKERPKEQRRTVLTFLTIMPWERTRLLKLIENKFQNTSQSVTLMEKAIYDRTVPFDDAVQQTKAARYWGGGGNIRSGLDTFTDHSMWLGGVDGSTVYENELHRRATLLEMALWLWYKERGSLPETLDELQGVYLKEVPKVPGLEVPFVYRPDPTKIDLQQWYDRDYVSYSTIRANDYENVPYFYAPIHDDYRRALGWVDETRFLLWAKPAPEPEKTPEMPESTETPEEPGEEDPFED